MQPRSPVGVGGLQSSGMGMRCSVAAMRDESDRRPTRERPAEHDREPQRDAGRDHERSADVIRFPSNTRTSPDAIDAPAADDPRLRDVIGEVLRAERLRQGRTLADVAGAAAVSLPYLSEVERGRKEVSSDLLDAIGDALELPLVDVLEHAIRRLSPRMQRGSVVRLRAA